MDKIQHKTIAVNGINLHVAEIGSGPAVLFLHGFPELWYTWRHQMLSLSSRGYRAIAPDLRGYGDSDAPPSVASYTTCHVIGDLVGLLNALGLDRVFLVGHDWGAIIAWNFCLFRPDSIKALVNLSVAFRPRNHLRAMRDVLGEDFYMCRFQEPGVAEAEFGRSDIKTVMKSLLTNRDPTPPCVPKEIGFGAFWQAPVTLPSWLTEEDINYFATKFSAKGFTGGLNYYRNMDINSELTAPWNGAQIKVPVKFIIGDLDITYHFPGTKDYLHSDEFKKDVPLLQEVVVIEGAAHFINQEKADEISNHIYDFIHKFKD